MAPDSDGSGVAAASLDHAMWFHRPVRVDEWLLHDQESPSASGGRGLGLYEREAFGRNTGQMPTPVADIR